LQINDLRGFFVFGGDGGRCWIWGDAENQENTIIKR